MDDKKPLSRYGVGPFYAALVFVLTFAVLLLNHRRMLPVFELAFLKLPAVVCVAAAGALWFNAVFGMKIAKHIRRNELVTSGAYGWVRNPIYAAIMLLMWGLLLWSGNLYLLVLCPVYHILMAVMVKCTEEKWLAARYGKAYEDYCSRVNRCIPWLPKR